MGGVRGEGELSMNSEEKGGGKRRGRGKKRGGHFLRGVLSVYFEG